MPEQVINLPRQQMRAAVQPSTYNSEARTIEVVVSTGARVLRGWHQRYYEELAISADAVRMDRLNSGAPVLNTHDSWDLGSILGVVERAWLDKGEIRASIRFSERDDVAPYIRDVASGVIRNISVGYTVHRFEQVSGGSDEIPVYRAVDWEPYEVSLVPIPADAGAGVRSADASAGPTNPCIFVSTRAAGGAQHEAIAMAKTTDTAATNQNEAATDQIQETRTNPAPAAPSAPAPTNQAAEILRACRAAGLDLKAAEDFVDRGLDINAVRAEIIAGLEKRQTETANTSSVNRVEITGDARDKRIESQRNWLLEKAAVTDTITKAKLGDNFTSQHRGMSLVDLARESLEASGVNTRGMRPIEIASRAFQVRAGMNTTSDFAVLLESTMHKVLLGAFRITADTWTRFCAIGSLSDFRPHNRYRMGTLGTLDALNEHGEFKQKQIPDGAKESLIGSTKGNIIGITREAIVDDDMGAFNKLAMMFGRAAKLTVESDVYALLALNSELGPALKDGKTLFHADHKNIGTGSALSVDGLDADRVLMGSQTDLSGNEYLDLRPAVLLVPIGLGGNARVINAATYDPDTANKLQKPNKVSSLFRDIVDTARLTGTRRYLFADPNEAPVIEVAFLDGQREPQLAAEEGFDYNGARWRVRYEYGVGAVGYEGAVTNAGA